MKEHVKEYLDMLNEFKSVVPDDIHYLTEGPEGVGCLLTMTTVYHCQLHYEIGEDLDFCVIRS